MLICSGDTPVALAGIMGGEGSKVGHDTSRLLLEVAHFDPVVVRRTSARLALRTDSSARFEKSLDPCLPVDAAAHFARLLQALQPDVRFPAPPTDAGDWTAEPLEITLRPGRVRSALGTDIGDEEIRSILERLGFGVAAQGDAFRVSVPTNRSTKDIEMEQDLVEEVGRIHRYGNIAERTMMSEVVPPPLDDRRTLVRRIQDHLAGAARFHEVLSYSFLSDDLLEKVGMASLPHVRVINPASQGEDKVRRSVLPSLLPGLEHNRRLREDVRLFEIGKGYWPENANERGEPEERHLLGLVWASSPPGRKARFDADRLTQLRGVIVELFDHLGLEAPDWQSGGDVPAWAHPSKSLHARWQAGDAPAALVAELEPQLVRAIGLHDDLASDVAVAEISLDRLLEAPRIGERYRPIPRFPGIKLDVAVALPEATPAEAVAKAIEQAGKGMVADVELFDLYRGESVGAGKKSLAYHVLLQSPTKTLTDKDEQKFLRRFEQLLGEAGGELRKG
jgi:phenylalanyl-tRNA synthetase beta chain